ncbi:MAG: fructose-6-phosphate aldolase [Alphaproteobacteria bacterium]|jgi:transaldolase
MEFFVDTAEISEIKHLKEIGLIDGVTTNPSLILKSGRDFKQVIKEICDLLPKKPISAEVTALDFDGMVSEGEKLAKIASNVVIKLPLTIDGLKACKYFSEKKIKTNVTLCFSANQALLAGKAGATYISPFVGRLDDISQVGMELITQIRQIYDNYKIETKILVASVRGPAHVLESALIGADVATIPYKIVLQLADHPLTKAGIEKFTEDWKKTGQKI